MRQCWFCYGDNNSGMGDACDKCLHGFQEREDRKKAAAIKATNPDECPFGEREQIRGAA